MQFMEFLKNRNFSYFEKIKNKEFENIDKNLYEELIKEYIEKNKFQENYDFSDAVFFDIGIFKNFYNPTKSLVFKNSIFIKRIRFDNVVCKKLVFKECEFLNGGRIKNKGDKALNIKKLIFEPYRLDGDFIIDIGKYAGETGIEVDSEGIIEEIKFENNQIGNGRVFFIGLNEYLKKGDFRNNILDNVIFQNCDLRNCYFLNSRVEKTEFRNVLFSQFLDYNFFIVRNYDVIDKIAIVKILIGLTFLWGINWGLFFDLDKILYAEFYYYSLFLLIYIFFYILFLGLIDLIFIEILNIFNNFKNKDGFYMMNYHFGVKDEEAIIANIKEKNFLKAKETIKSLTDLYSQLANNLSKKDAQISGEFVYSNKLFKSYIFYNFFEIIINKYHHFINGFGQRWLRALFHFIVTILFFSWIFVYGIKPNKDYISTYNTPYFLLQKNSTIIYDKSGFGKTLYKHEKKCFIENNTMTLYGYDDITNQKIFKLKERNLMVGFYKSLSNLFYPFSFESKKWFQNISQKAIFVSFLEAILLWMFLIAFFKALWNRLKF